jgi:hypothetical protein
MTARPAWLSGRRRRDDTGGELPPASLRQRLLIALAAVAVAVAVGMAILKPQLELGQARQRSKVPQPCAPGQASGCVGGVIDVIVVPAASAAAR